jgi:hypothetical protein
LSCFNQFDLGFDAAHDSDDRQQPQLHERKLKELISTLIYGLFRPLLVPEAALPDIQLTRTQLFVLASQLRINRRRGMVPALLSLVTFYLAFAFSVVLAFSDWSDSTSIFVLDVGIFFSWVPILVVFFLLDRNPSNSTHQA